MNKEELKTKLDEIGLTHVSEKIASLAKMSIRFSTSQSTEEEIPVGASKVGGYPDLPSNHIYPTWKNEPLSFLAQINLADISNFDAASKLPSSGVVSFFYSASQETWGFDPKDKGSWQVYYFLDPKDLLRVGTPKELSDEGLYSPCLLSFFEELTIPPWESILIEELGLNREEMSSYINLAESITSDVGGLVNRILGYPEQIQGDMQIECQMVSNGIYYGDAKAHKHPRYKELIPGSTDWELLLQLDSEEDNAKMMWGDVGRVYFWIHQEALEKRDFGKVWFQLQCS
ncbi:MAG: DUF1963 domain-containing protein [Anaerolineales bacterium]|nr:DUF1963 domain-containing protein [Anaerolineales bacterium]